jgi:hypothetical protein
MAVELNHTIVPPHNGHASAEFLADLLGLPIAGEAGPSATPRTYALSTNRLEAATVTWNAAPARDSATRPLPRLHVRRT